MDVTGLLHLLKAEPSLLERAPDASDGQAISRCCQDGGHSCLCCPDRATRAAIVIIPGGGNRWLDLCDGHFAEVSLNA